jgi:ribokinase
VVLAQNEVPVESVAAAFTAAREVGAMLTILNAAPAEPAALALFGLTDLLVVNEHELARYAALAGITGANEAALARALLERCTGAPRLAVVVTLGARGCLAVWRDRQVIVPAWKVVPVDTIGAGDCFCGVLAALLARGQALEAALPLPMPLPRSAHKPAAPCPPCPLVRRWRPLSPPIRQTEHPCEESGRPGSRPGANCKAQSALA